MSFRKVDRTPAHTGPAAWSDIFGPAPLRTPLGGEQWSDVTDVLLAEDEPTKLPPHPFDTIGANACMRWKEWQARLE